MDKIAGIYMIRNIVNNKKYIGQAIDIKTRWSKHKSDLKKGIRENPYFLNSWNKYGYNNFEFKILLRLPKTKWILNFFEMFFVWMFNTKIPNGYNATIGGNGTNGFKPTIEQINKSIEVRDKKYKNKQLDFGKFDKNLGNTNNMIISKSINGKNKDSISKFYGVAWNTNSKKWRANITINKKQSTIGLFKTEIEAAKAYDAVNWFYFHDFNKLNFPEDYKMPDYEI